MVVHNVNEEAAERDGVVADEVNVAPHKHLPVRRVVVAALAARRADGVVVAPAPQVQVFVREVAAVPPRYPPLVERLQKVLLRLRGAVEQQKLAKLRRTLVYLDERGVVQLLRFRTPCRRPQIRLLRPPRPTPVPQRHPLFRP